ncbi:hypothetical protein D3C81_1006520 [compost metagenome]
MVARDVIALTQPRATAKPLAPQSTAFTAFASGDTAAIDTVLGGAQAIEVRTGDIEHLNGRRGRCLSRGGEVGGWAQLSAGTITCGRGIQCCGGVEQIHQVGIKTGVVEQPGYRRRAVGGGGLIDRCVRDVIGW